MRSLLDADPLDLSILDLLVRVAGTDTPPETLYHYTDFHGLKGIIESHSLRATFSRTLNDSTEQRHGEEFVRRALQEMVDHDLRDKIAAGMKDRPDRYRSFVTCFCSDPNLLSMWRAYAYRGGGYCLGFDSSELRNLVNEQPSKHKRQQFNWLFQIVYEPETRLRDSLQELTRLIEQDPTLPLSFAVARILAGKIKHESFKEEHEWRIIVHDPTFEEMQFREGHNNIIPYIDLRRQPGDGERLLPLRKVVCGPTLRNDDESLEIVNWMLAKHGYNGVAIERCEIPYRL